MVERTVNPRQREVLRWIVDGCPEGVMRDVTYKTTAVALQNRRLVTVSRKRGVWKAEATPAGRYFVEHGSYPDGHWWTPGPRSSAGPVVISASRSPSSTPISTPTSPRSRRITGRRPVDQMLVDVEAAGTAGFSIEECDRGRFENLISSAERYGKAPEGKQLRIERDKASRTVVRLATCPPRQPVR